MPQLHRLRRAGFAVWPFDAPALPLALEIYPRALYKRPLVKSDRRQREAYVACEDGIPHEWKRAAAETDDAFDAAVAAVGMSEHADDLRALPPIYDETLRIEGIIWRPGWRAAHGR
jgi:hypothetical protein